MPYKDSQKQKEAQHKSYLKNRELVYERAKRWKRKKRALISELLERAKNENDVNMEKKLRIERAKITGGRNHQINKARCQNYLAIERRAALTDVFENRRLLKNIRQIVRKTNGNTD